MGKIQRRSFCLLPLQLAATAAAAAAAAAAPPPPFPRKLPAEGSDCSYIILKLNHPLNVLNLEQYNFRLADACVVQ